MPVVRRHERIAEYKALLDLYIRACEAMAGRTARGPDAWISEAEYLAAKLLFHLASLLYLRPGTRFEELAGQKIHFFDFASSAVLTRSAFETFLTFYFIFIAPETSDERRLRYLVWQLGGLLDRQRFTVISPEGRQRLKDEVTAIEKIRSQIEENPAYSQLPRKRRDDARNGRWKFGNSWVQLAAVAGSSQRYFVTLYAYLSSYADAGYLSALQIGQAQYKDDQYELGESYIGIGLTLMSHFLLAYASLFPPVAEIISVDPEAKALLQKWHLTGEDMEALYDGV